MRLLHLLELMLELELLFEAAGAGVAGCCSLELLAAAHQAAGDFSPVAAPGGCWTEKEKERREEKRRGAKGREREGAGEGRRGAAASCSELAGRRKNEGERGEAAVLERGRGRE
ncbi:hypothetical protein KY285_029865 [Solanum tuberosum]|nr:hypothetical protein KY285_029865 [Solanum tuberosum]